MPEGPLPEYGLYLGEASLRAKHDASLTWPHDWLDWPDFRLPRDGDAAIAAIHALHQRALVGERVEVACKGGVGRTGTVVACLAVLAGVPRRGGRLEPGALLAPRGGDALAAPLGASVPGHARSSTPRMNWA